MARVENKKKNITGGDKRKSRTATQTEHDMSDLIQWSGWDVSGHC